jgi:peptidoglycan hydrolase FlgJ
VSQSIVTTLPSRMALPDDGSDTPAAVAADDSPAAPPQYRSKVTQAAENFEGFFIEQMLQQMRRTQREMDPDEADDAKRGDDDMLDMADTLLADSLSHSHAFGVADAILRQLLPPKKDAALKEKPRPVA